MGFSHFHGRVVPQNTGASPLPHTMASHEAVRLAGGGGGFRFNAYLILQTPAWVVDSQGGAGVWELRESSLNEHRHRVSVGFTLSGHIRRAVINDSYTVLPGNCTGTTFSYFVSHMFRTVSQGVCILSGQ